MFSRLLKFLTCMSLSVMITVFGFSACQDLGEDVKTEEDYYALFPTVSMICNDEIDTVDMEDIYNKETSDSLSSPFETDKEYQYMVIEVDPPSGQVLTCDSVAMYILYSGDKNVTLEASCYIGDDALYEKITNKDVPFNESAETSVGRATVNLKAKINTPNARQPQNSFVLSFTRSDFVKSSYIVIVFKRKTLDYVAFRPTNVMIHTNSLKNGE